MKLNHKKCGCGKTKDTNGNCDGSHANKYSFVKSISYVLVALIAVLSLQSFLAPHIDTIMVKESQIAWKGFKVTGSHEGNISLKSGRLEFNHGNLVGGSFVMDMQSIVCTDLTGDSKDQLEGHLKSSDFFGTETHPTSSLTFQTVSRINDTSYNVKAEVTIKGKTEKVEFTTTINANKASGTLKIDRTKFDIKYGSGSFFDGLGDNMIYDEFELTMNINF